MKEVEERLADRKTRLAVSLEAKEYLAAVGYSPIYGARPLDRAIQTELFNPLSVLIFDNAVRDGANGMDVDWETPDDDVEIEEMD